jgi:hypothetical protein
MTLGNAGLEELYKEWAGILSSIVSLLVDARPNEQEAVGHSHLKRELL